MVRLVMLLLGAPALRERWSMLLAAGLLDTALAIAIVTDAADGVTAVATETFGWIPVADGLSTLAVGQDAHAKAHRLDLARALGLIVLGLLILNMPWRNDIANSVHFGLAFLIDGTARILTALVVRFRSWAVVMAGGALELVLAVLAFASWPVSYEKTVPFCIGVLLLLAGWTVLRLALAVRRLPADGSVLALRTFGSRCWYAHAGDGLPGSPASGPGPAARTGDPPLVLHVWTPLGSAADPVRRPLLDRWIAAVDRKGQVSTGHAALELPPDVYISHYPRAEVERSTTDFVNQLRATAANDVPGRFLPSCRHEVDTWFEVDAHILFRHFDAARLRAHWAAYSKNDTYNLTRRNCSVAAAVAIQGRARRGVRRRAVLAPPARPGGQPRALGRRGGPPPGGEAMTWTPGLVLDYARALHHVVDPRRVGRLARLMGIVRRFRRARGMARAAKAAVGKIPA